MSQRVALVDIARTVAIVGMVIFHFTYDLELFGFVARGTMASPEWIRFAKIIASSFIFLSGMSLVLGTLSNPLDARKYGKRLVVLAVAAIAVSLGTYVAMGAAFVRFGILHLLFASSILGLLFLNRPYWLPAIVGALILWLPYSDAWPFLEASHWLWLGRTQMVMPPMVDYIPLIPWFGMFVLGMASAQLLQRLGLWGAIAGLLDPTRKSVRVLSWPGQHSLAVYLCHQPILFGGVSLARILLGTA